MDNLGLFIDNFDCALLLTNRQILKSTLCLLDFINQGNHKQNNKLIK